MFDKLLDQLNSLRAKSEQRAATLEVEEIIKRPPSPETAKLMRRIQNSRAMLTVKVAGSEDTYLSAVLDVDAEEGYIVIDELNSPSGHRALCVIKQLEISTRLADREIIFQCAVTAIGEDGGVSYYKIPFPENLEHQLRRKHLRITTPRGKRLAVHMHTELQDLVTGELIDLSSGGFSATLSRESADKVRHGDLVPKCMLYLGGPEPIETELEIRYCEDKRYHSRPRLGGKFINMAQSSERRLQRYISQIDRLNAKNIASD